MLALLGLGLENVAIHKIADFQEELELSVIDLQIAFIMGLPPTKNTVFGCIFCLFDKEGRL